ncbi:unnamed protein product [Rhizopus stolonifer]
MEKISDELTKGLQLKENEEKCDCFVKHVYRLPCQHEPLRSVDMFASVPLNIVHPRWRIGFYDGRVAKVGEISPVFGEIHPVTQSFKDSMEEQFRLRCEEAMINFKDIFNSSKTYQEKQNMLDELEILTENIKKKSIDYVLSPTIVGTTKGRPKKEKRDFVGFERAQESYKEIMSKKKRREN